MSGTILTFTMEKDMLDCHDTSTTEQPTRATTDTLKWLATLGGASTAPEEPKGGLQLLTTREVASILRISPATVRKLHRDGRLRAHPDFPTKLLFRARDVAAFLKGV